ncbi:HEPACAM family member 2-like [Archocentrus centrarchus]|uniref:HEPACAM family member 2-like n=1 Tax=Archocentrus centrarchus TaxID=63155 RepID=UPI0011EA4A59|nr:HEPACAM family member 2-like [Archocentrus centrarchus]
MAVCAGKTVWSFMFLLAGAVGQTVIYPFTSTCAVRGSTVTLPCSFTPLKSFNEGGREVPLKIVRVRWCQNHELCQGTTPSVYDSKSTKKDSNYQYLGDMKTNCTLQIRDVQERDEGTFRFRMEVNYTAGHFTNRTGVTVRVNDGTKMRIISSSEDKKFRGNETVTLLCTSLCTFHQLEVTWFKDGHALSETGPSLHLSPLTAEDSGNYTCALKASNKTLSELHSLQVEVEEKKGEQKGQDKNLPLVVGVVFGVLLAVITLILFLFIIKRRLAAAAEDQRAVGGETEQKYPDNIYSSIQEENLQQETSHAVEDDSYATIQFNHSQQKHRHVEKAEDAVIYSSLAS